MTAVTATGIMLSDTDVADTNWIAAGSKLTLQHKVTNAKFAQIWYTGAETEKTILATSTEKGDGAKGLVVENGFVASLDKADAAGAITIGQTEGNLVKILDETGKEVKSEIADVSDSKIKMANADVGKYYVAVTETTAWGDTATTNNEGKAVKVVRDTDDTPILEIKTTGLGATACSVDGVLTLAPTVEVALDTSVASVQAKYGSVSLAACTINSSGQHTYIAIGAGVEVTSKDVNTVSGNAGKTLVALFDTETDTAGRPLTTTTEGESTQTLPSTATTTDTAVGRYVLNSATLNGAEKVTFKMITVAAAS